MSVDIWLKLVVLRIHIYIFSNNILAYGQKNTVKNNIQKLSTTLWILLFTISYILFITKSINKKKKYVMLNIIIDKILTKTFWVHLIITGLNYNNCIKFK